MEKEDDDEGDVDADDYVSQGPTAKRQMRFINDDNNGKVEASEATENEEELRILKEKIKKKEDDIEKKENEIDGYQRAMKEMLLGSSYNPEKVKDIEKTIQLLQENINGLRNDRDRLDIQLDDLKREKNQETINQQKYQYGNTPSEAIFSKFCSDGFLSKVDLSNVDLQPYQLPPESQHASIFNQHKVPTNPETGQPFFQFHDLSYTGRSESLSKQTLMGNTIIFAPSGAGKTRLLYEFATEKYAMMFLARSNISDMQENPVWSLSTSSWSLSLSQIGKPSSSLTPKKWLLLQLFPTVDEAQILYMGMDGSNQSYRDPPSNGPFVSFTNPSDKQTLFWRFLEMRNTGIKHGVIFAGTGVSMLYVNKELSSAMGGKNARDPFFFELTPFKQEHVKEQLMKYIDVKMYDDKMNTLGFYSMWLSGRPRNVFRVIESCVQNRWSLQQSFWEYIQLMVNGKDGTARTSMRKAVERLSLSMADDLHDSKEAKMPKNNIMPFFVDFCYKYRFGIGKIDNSDLYKHVKANIPDTEKDTLEEMVMLLVEYGFVFAKNKEEIIIPEPIVHEAVAKVFFTTIKKSAFPLKKSMDNSAISTQNNMAAASSSSTNNPRLFQFPPKSTSDSPLPDFIKKSWKIQQAKYGQLVMSENENYSLFEWLDEHSNNNVKFYDKPTPFFKPCNDAGPDFAMVLRNSDDVNAMLLVLAQVKFRNDVVVKEALHTVDPTKLYHINRGKSPGFNGGQEHLPARFVDGFENILKLLEKQQIPVVRLLLVYPKKTKSNLVCVTPRKSTFKVLASETVKTRGNDNKTYAFEGNEVHDVQIVIGANNMGSFVEKEALELLDAMKSFS